MADIQPIVSESKRIDAQTNVTDSAYVGFWGDVYGSFVNTFRSQGNGVIQLANRAGANLEEVKPVHTDDPNSGIGAWSASLVGQSGAMAVELFAAQKLGAGLRVLAGKETAAAALTGAESVKSRLYASTAFGAFMGGVLTPSNDPESFWQDRAKNMFSSTISIGGMTGISLGLEAQAAKLGSGTAAAVLRNGYFHNAVGGALGGAVGDMTSLALNGQGPSLTADYWKQVGRAGAEFALVGMGAHTFNLAGKSAYNMTQQARAEGAESQPRHIAPDAVAAGIPEKLAPNESRSEQFAARLLKETWNGSHESAQKLVDEAVGKDGRPDELRRASLIAMRDAIRDGDFSSVKALLNLEIGGRKLVTETDLQAPENKAAAAAGFKDSLSERWIDMALQWVTFKVGNQWLITADDVTSHQLQHAAAESYMSMLSRGPWYGPEVLARVEVEGRRLLVDDPGELARTALARALREGSSKDAHNIIQSKVEGKDLIVPDDAGNSEIRSAAIAGLHKLLTGREPFFPNLQTFLDLQIGEHRLITESDLQSDTGRSTIRSAFDELWADPTEHFSNALSRSALLLDDYPSIYEDVSSAARNAQIKLLPHNPFAARELSTLVVRGMPVISVQ
ncbi:MAG: hypothetical protein DKT66_24745 [Candidatus Melainabacteria bacterium]|nr:MAG: hypothetical protein DKT66_24745 [Candidatus Melainabacteria bacterium]